MGFPASIYDARHPQKRQNTKIPYVVYIGKGSPNVILNPQNCLKDRRSRCGWIKALKLATHWTVMLM